MATSAIVAAFRPTDAGIPTKGIRSFGFDRGGGHTHQGIDMLAPRHGPARSVADGVVTHASNSLAQGFSGYGRHVVIKHGKKGPWFLFAHLEHASVKRGDKVKLGQHIGTVGDSCFSRSDPAKRCKGVHLHFEVSPTRYGTEAHPGQDSEAPRLDPVAWLTRNAHRTPPPTPTPAKSAKLPLPNGVVRIIRRHVAADDFDAFAKAIDKHVAAERPLTRTALLTMASIHFEPDQLAAIRTDLKSAGLWKEIAKPKRLGPHGDWVFLLPVAVLLSGFFIFIAGTTARKWGVTA